MLSNPTRICPSPLLKCSAIRAGHFCTLRPVLFQRVRFTPGTELSRSLSHLHKPFSEKITTTARESLLPPNNKPRDIDGLTAGTCADEEVKEKVSDFVEGWSEEGKKKIIELLEGRNEEEKEEMIEFLKRWSEEETNELLGLLEGWSIKQMQKINYVVKENIEIFDEEESRTKVTESVKGLNIKEKKKKIMVAMLGLMPRTGFLKKVFGILGAQLLLGSVAYGAMKMSPAIIAAFQQNYFYLFYLLFTGGLFVVPTLQAFKDMSSVGEKSILNSIFPGLFNVAIVAIDVVLADIHLASSNGIIMVGALVLTLGMFALIIMVALHDCVDNGRSKDDFRDLGQSSIAVNLAVIASFIQIVNPGPISAAIDIGVNCCIFCAILFYDIWMMLNQYKNDEYMKASARLFIDLYGLFIVSIKVLGMVSGLFYFSSKMFGML